MVSVMLIQSNSSLAEDVTIQTPNGVMIGDVSDNSAILWSRANRKSKMTVELEGDLNDDKLPTVIVNENNNFTGQIHLHGLKPDSIYRYKVIFRDLDHEHSQSEKLTGSFRTAPRNETQQNIKFAWGGDVAGQNVCRDEKKGFPVFSAINQQQWNFFIGLGDLIYADGLCTATGRYGNPQIAGDFIKSADLYNYWAHWSYNRKDPGFQRLLANTPYLAVWDDHEVVNDFGPLHDTRSSAPYTPGEHLLPIGLKAFLDYNPVSSATEVTPKRLYRNIRWGKHVELFLLDTRQYRDANFMPDNQDAPKTMLGREQLTWLKEKLAASDATWKIIVSSVPMSIPTGFPPSGGRDGWGNFDQDGGFEYELKEILRFMQQHGIKNNVWLTTDVHFSEGFKYQPFSEHPDFNVYEFVSGPLNAGLFPNKAFDTSLGAERLFFYGAPKKLNYSQALAYFTYGAIEVADNGDMTVRIINALGDVVAEQFLPVQ